MKYALIQMPNGYIDIIDNSGSIGKGRVCRLIDEGGKPAGTVESEVPFGTLSFGLAKSVHDSCDELYDRIRLAREALDGNIQWKQVHPPKQEGSEHP